MIRQRQDRLVQLQRSHTPSNLPSSHILRNPTGIDPLTYTLPSNPPLVPPPKHVFEMQERRNHNAGTRHDSPIPILLTNTYSLTLRYPTGVDLPTYTPHSQYIHSLSRVPTGVDLPIYTSFSQYTPPYSPRPNPDLPTYASTIHTTLFSCPKRVDLPTYTPSPFTIHTTSFSCPKRKGSFLPRLAFLKFFLTSAGGRFGACILFRLASVWRSQARGAVTGADTVGDQLRGLVDPSGTPLHGCVVYQDDALLAVAPGAFASV